MTPPVLPLARPADEGVDAAGVAAFVTALETARQIEPHSLMLLRHGRVVAQGWWAPYAQDRPHLLYSLSKSFTSTAVAFAVAEGLFGLDDTVLSHFSELDGDITDPRSRRMTVRHLAAMASGHHDETIDRVHAMTDAVQDPAPPRGSANDTDVVVRGFLRIAPEGEPGTVFAYNQPCTYTLASLVRRASGQSLVEYLRPRLFDPLGITDVGWQRDRHGRELGFSGLHAVTDAVARLGLLYLQGGQWQGRQLLPAGWVEQATRSHVATPLQGGADWQQGYGLQFWRSRHGYRGDGAYGQFCVVLPEQDVVLVTTAATEDMQAVLDAAWQHLLPALHDEPLTGAAAAAGDDLLAARLAGLRLPLLDDVSPAPQDVVPGTDGWDGYAAEVGGDGPVRRIEVLRDGDGWAVTLVDTVASYRVRLGVGGWAVSEPPDPDGGVVPVATIGGWLDDGALRFDVTFLETPHRLQLTCTAAGGDTAEWSATQRWLTTPLHAGLIGQLHSPR
jgi:CubicO group peptidase (beta-lactamase class C family)